MLDICVILDKREDKVHDGISKKVNNLQIVEEERTIDGR